jgi:hypothetical protein
VVLAVAVTLLLVLSVLTFRFASPATTPTTSQVNPGNGLTFDQAFRSVNATVANLTGGPWQPTSILGIASEVPEAPLPNYRTSLNQTLRLCGELHGITVWNSSGIPVFTGSLNSGAAPFWSFIFKNGSGSYLYATNLEGTVRVDTPSSILANCFQAAGIGSSYIVNPSLDTPSVAQAAYSASGETFTIKHSPLVEYYVLGNAQLLETDASPFGWVVNYFRCDLVAVSGLQNYSAVGVLVSGGKSTTFIDSGWLTCTLSDYRMAFGAITGNSTSTFGSTTDLSFPFQVTSPGALKNNTTLYDGWGLLTWMTQLQLLGRNGQPLPISQATCQSWVSSLTDCPGNSSGWFVVLLSQSGAWLDAYPSATSSSTWTIPNVILSSQDKLVIVCPASWNESSDTFNSRSTPLAPEVVGSATL